LKEGNEAKDEAKKQPVKENNIIRSQALASRNKLTQLQLKRIVATISIGRQFLRLEARSWLDRTGKREAGCHRNRKPTWS